MTARAPAVRSLAILIALTTGLSACVENRSVVEIEQPPSTAVVQATTAAKITDVRDLRRFEVNPHDPSRPSLANENEIGDLQVTTRAVGRKYNSEGAQGDVILPERMSVAALVRNAATRALQESGYQVVDASSPEFNAAIPLAIDIEQFWVWLTPAALEISMDFESRLVLTGPLVDRSPTIVTSKSRKNVGIQFETYWIEVIQNGLADLTDKIKAQIPPAQ